jgi:hypothetical protein
MGCSSRHRQVCQKGLASPRRNHDSLSIQPDIELSEESDLQHFNLLSLRWLGLPSQR